MKYASNWAQLDTSFIISQSRSFLASELRATRKGIEQDLRQFHLLLNDIKAQANSSS